MRLLLLCLLLIGGASVVAQDNPLDGVLADFDPDGAAIVVYVVTPEGEWSVTTGLADGVRPVTPDDRFQLASVSKTFVSVTALLLVDAGVIALDEPVAPWLPAEVVDRVANADTTTLRQLLGMTSGIDDYLDTDAFWDAVLADPDRVWTPEAALAFIYDARPLFAPDEDYDYSNSNYLLAQLALEGASGQPLHTLMRDYLLDPLGLADTFTEIAETPLGTAVTTYDDADGDGTFEDVSLINQGNGLADGGLISTVYDLTAFYAALFDEESLLSDESLEALLDFDEDEGYGLGVTLDETPFGDAWGHSGGMLGVETQALYFPDLEAYAVALCAMPDCDAYGLALAALERVG